jgi:hypothetical protein
MSFTSSFLGITTVYEKYEDEGKYDPSLGEIVIDTDMSVPRIILADNGASEYVIVKGDEATESESFAAETLQKYLKQISGVEIPIVTDADTPEQEKEIIIGRTDREGDDTFTIDRGYLGEDGLNIFVYNEKLVLAGGGNRGTLYSVFTFLEETQGCRWFAADLTVVPELTTVSARKDLNIEQIPIFYNRDVYWKCAFDSDFSVANKINGYVSRDLSGKYGGGMVYGGPFFVHTFAFLVPPAQYFDEHPEYYALTEGKRQTYQLCLTNPDVLRIATESALGYLRQNPDADIISISQNDGEGFCECENCKAIDDAEGSHAGTLLRFVNAVAEEIEKEFPDVLVDTLAYDYTRKAPSITRPRENVVIRLCTIECCFSHPLDECPVLDKSGKRITDDIREWKAICDNIHIWDYTTNYSHYLTPYPNFAVLQPNIQFFAENNVKSVFEQGEYQIVNNGEFAQLKAYLLAKLLWDPYTDIEKHMNEFMRAYYGEGYQYIRRYIDFTVERASAFHIVLNMNPAEVLYLSSNDLKKIDEWWDKAEAMAKNQAELDHIQCSRIQVRYYKNFTRQGEFALLRNNAQVGEALYDDLMRFGITRIKERVPLKPKSEIDFMTKITEWNMPRS